MDIMTEVKEILKKIADTERELKELKTQLYAIEPKMCKPSLRYGMKNRETIRKKSNTRIPCPICDAMVPYAHIAIHKKRNHRPLTF